MTRAKWFLALAGGLLGTAVALSAPPPHHPMPAGGARPAPRPVAHPMPVTRPAPVVTRPGPVVSNARPGVIHPQPAVTRSPLTGSLPGVSGVQAGALTRKPLLTNPHPTATTVRPAASAARNSAAFHSSGVAALAASSGKSPAEVALFLASQRHYDPWGGYGWGGYGWG